MSDSYLATWARNVTAGQTISADDLNVLARIAQALDNADKHHRQAREAHAALDRVRYPSEAVEDAVKQTAWDAAGVLVGRSAAREILRDAVHRAEMEVWDDTR